MLSIWEKESFLHYQFAIVGSGIIGLNIAIFLKQKHPTAKIVIIERGLLPTGASTKNAGFACMGSPTELLEDLETNSTQEVVELFALRKKGLDRTLKMYGAKNIGYEKNGSYELLDSSNINALDKIVYLNKLLQDVTNKQDAFSHEKNIINKNKFNAKHLIAAIENNLEGALHSGMYMQTLLLQAQTLGIELKTGATLTNYTSVGSGNIIELNNAFTINAEQLIFCNNAFAKEFFPDLDIEPGRGQVLVTKPIDNLIVQGIYHMGTGYYYFRNFNNRIIFGGGRNLDFTTENTLTFGKNEEILQHLQKMLKETILPTTPFEIDYTWSGIMAFGKNKKPIIKQHAKGIYVCARMGGMGVAIGCETAWQMVETYF